MTDVNCTLSVNLSEERWGNDNGGRVEGAGGEGGLANYNKYLITIC